MTSRALPLADPAGAHRALRWVMFAGCGAALFVLASATTATWEDVTTGVMEDFRTQLEVMTIGHDAGNARRQAAGLALAVLGGGALLLGRGAAKLRPRGALGWLLLAYLALFPLSVLWAETPHLAIRRGLAFGTMALAVAAVVRLLPASALVAFATLGAAAYVLVAFALELGGSFRPFSADYRFSGPFHPNHVAAFAAVLILGASCAERARTRLWLLAFAVPAGAAVLLLSRTRTAAAALLVAVAARALVAARPWRRALGVTAVAWLACATLVLARDELGRGFRGALVAIRPDSRVETLSGRTALWDELVGYSAQRPVLGYGLGSFWDADRTRAIYTSQRWAVSHAHSVYVDHLLQLGAVGLTLHLLVMAAALRRAARLLRATGRGAHAFMFSVLVYLLVTGLLETVQPDPGFLSFLSFWTLGLLAFRGGPAVASRRAPCTSR